jgi:hypothetical protein
MSMVDKTVHTIEYEDGLEKDVYTSERVVDDGRFD